MFLEIKDPSTFIDVDGKGERVVYELLKSFFGRNIKEIRSYRKKKDSLDIKETWVWKERQKRKITTGEMLWHDRKDLGWTQKKLAEKSGVPQTALSDIEKNKRQPELSTLKKLAKAFGCDYRLYLPA